MGDIKLFKLSATGSKEIEGKSVTLEKSLQSLIEINLDVFLGVRFLATEYGTGAKHGGRIDTLGMDENGCPVIIEYKRATNENVINQGLYYLDWLLDHRAEFELLAMKLLGKEAADEIEWDSPRLLCIAGEFTKYDEHAVKQINRNIELIRYRKYEDELLLLELVNATTASAPASSTAVSPVAGGKGTYKTFLDYYAQAKPELRDRYEALKAFVMALGDDVHLNQLKYYVAFKRLKNFCCVEVHPQTNAMLVYLKLDPKTMTLEKDYSRDMTNKGHYGTGDLELTIRTMADFEKSKPLILQSYELS